jgi:hypothetical protein
MEAIGKDLIIGQFLATIYENWNTCPTNQFKTLPMAGEFLIGNRYDGAEKEMQP